MMNEQIIQLETFHMSKVLIEFVHTEGEPFPSGLAELSLSIDYNVAIKADDDLRYRLSLLVSVNPKEIGMHIDAQIDGFFLCPAEMPVPVRNGTIRVNGGTILYGLLRGQLAALSGSFPSGPYTLPTVSMLDVVRRKEGISTEKPSRTGVAEIDQNSTYPPEAEESETDNSLFHSP